MFNDDVDYFSEFEKGNLKGFIAFENFEQVNQCLIVYSDGFGLRDYFKKIASQFVTKNVAVFCADMFGNQKSFKSYGEAVNTLNFLTNENDIFRSRALAAFSFAKDYFKIESVQITTLGFCFGAASALEVMRSGCNLKGIITLHGKLILNSQVDPKVYRPKIISFHGDKDPFIESDEIKIFKEEMDSVQGDVTFITFSNTAHNFTNPSAGNSILSGSAYNEFAHRRSFDFIKYFLSDTNF